MSLDQRFNNNLTTIFTIFLLLCLITGVSGCIAFGMQTTVYYHNPGYSTSIATDSGKSGGALGCGVLAAASIYGLVKVFLAKAK